MSEAEGLVFKVYSNPDEVNALISFLQQNHRLYLDTEVADWNTKSPRLSLIQITNGDGKIHIIDVLAPGITELIAGKFIPAIMQNENIKKWAHNASYERRFLGCELVASLSCTLSLARSVPFHRLPLRSLSLKSLVRYFFGFRLDKTFQTADWGTRPIPNEQLVYAASDPEWCRRIHEKLSSCNQVFDVMKDSPNEINDLYMSLLPRLALAKSSVNEIRDTVKEYMESNSLRFFSDFSLHHRLSQLIQVPTLIKMASERDPARIMDFTILLSNRLLDQLVSNALTELQSKIATSLTSMFIGPVLPTKVKPKACKYILNSVDPHCVALDYLNADEELRICESNKTELRSRMRAWLEFSNLRLWEKWKISDLLERRHIDIRDLEPFIAFGSSCDMNLPKKFQICFAPEEIENAQDSIITKTTPVLIWRPGIFAGVHVSEARDWYEAYENEN